MSTTMGLCVLWAFTSVVRSQQYTFLILLRSGWQSLGTCLEHCLCTFNPQSVTKKATLTLTGPFCQAQQKWHITKYKKENTQSFLYLPEIAMPFRGDVKPIFALRLNSSSFCSCWTTRIEYLRDCFHNEPAVCKLLPFGIWGLKPSGFSCKFLGLATQNYSWLLRELRLWTVVSVKSSIVFFVEDFPFSTLLLKVLDHWHVCSFLEN